MGNLSFVTHMTIQDNDISSDLQQRVLESIASKQPLYIHGGNSKAFYGNTVDAKPLDVSQHTGIISYEPTELCVTLRAGTLLSDLETLLNNTNQILPFEPPQYTTETTIGGAIAAGISGPRRAYTGSVRDAILGVKIINGNGEIVSFGGQVMKNVAGYDLSRMMVRSQGTLGVILEVSLRLLPKPQKEITLTFESDQTSALQFFRESRLQQLPITASAWFNDQVYLRLSESETVLEHSKKKLGFDLLGDYDDFWTDIRDHQHHFFGRTDKPLWRLSLPPATKQISSVDDNQLIEWGGAQRWINSNAPANIIQNIATSNNGYAYMFKGDLPETPCFPVLDKPLMLLHKQLKRNMDPNGIFSPGRIYSGL